MTLVLLGKADVLEDSQRAIRTSTGELAAPSVVKMKYQVRRPIPQLRLSRHSVLARDSYTCQYCGSKRDLTIDHVVPRWCGGPHTWDNLVACCRKCNLKKGDKTPAQANMKLRTKPKQPHYVPYLSLPKYLKAIQRSEWAFYLPVFKEFSTTVN
ncbi:MAG: HNH endonuclease [Fimbriimonadaceae bacterium]|nr:HNH endonuclease [Fimbriimonadaceae bacterium]QYK57065.1 MAG: HNH endonuclease [Fimbriimonadaceae bacterium]